MTNNISYNPVANTITIDGNELPFELIEELMEWKELPMWDRAPALEEDMVKMGFEQSFQIARALELDVEGCKTIHELAEKAAWDLYDKIFFISWSDLGFPEREISFEESVRRSRESFERECNRMRERYQEEVAQMDRESCKRANELRESFEREVAEMKRNSPFNW